MSYEAALGKEFPKVEWRMDDVGPRLARVVAETFRTFARAYPKPLTLLEYVGTTKQEHLKMKPNAWASLEEDGATMNLNSKFWDDYDRLKEHVARAARKHWRPSGDVSFPLWHELGHLVLDYLERTAAGQCALQDWMRRHRAPAALSEYALTKPHEAFAEGFAALALGAPPNAYTRAQASWLQGI